MMLVGWMAVAAHASPCDRAEVAKVVQALPQVSADQQGMLAAAGLSEACPRAGAFTTSAGRLGQVMPEQRRMIDAQLALEDVGAWIAACPGGPSALAASMQLARAEARALLWKSCALSATGWFEAAEWSRLDGPVVVPLVAGRLLADAGVGPADLKTLVRALAGLPHPQTRPPEPRLELEPLMQLPPPPDDE